LPSAVDDGDVGSGRTDTAGYAEVVGDRLAELLMTSWVGVDAAAHVDGPELPAHQPTPGLMGEEAGVGVAAGEVELRGRKAVRPRP